MTREERFLLGVISVLAVTFSSVAASRGDRSTIFEVCTQRCILQNCSSNFIDDFHEQQPVVLQLLWWNCRDECKYECMWTTVDWFAHRGEAVPQFYGKWPFIRLFGIQEPASAIFSVLNGVVHLIQWHKFSKVVPSHAPMYYVHLGNAIVCVNAWFWSTVFHSRDLFFTEMMDYFCALMGVTYLTFLLFVRIAGPKPSWKHLAIGALCLSFYVRHICYLAFVKFDYQYNMTVAVLTGLFNFFAWITWSIFNRRSQPYVWKCAATVITLNVLLAFEVGDFPPILYILDAHSLWHLGTIPIPILWYSFAIDDCLFLLNEQKIRDKGS